jgi:hypothetical protein
LLLAYPLQRKPVYPAVVYEWLYPLVPLFRPSGVMSQYFLSVNKATETYVLTTVRIGGSFPPCCLYALHAAWATCLLVRYRLQWRHFMNRGDGSSRPIHAGKFWTWKTGTTLPSCWSPRLSPLILR